MPVVTNLEQKILQLIRQDKYSWFTVGVNLAGEPGASGGSGVPPGGFTGQLIQSRVTYDTSEAASLDVPVSLSGASLLHNLNRIRYWLNDKNPAFIVQDDGVEIASGITVMDFIGAPVTVELVDGYTDRVAITISGTGGGIGSSGIVLVSADDTLANYLENKLTAASSKITVTTANPGGNEERQVDLGAVNIDDLDDVVIVSVGNDEILGYSGGWMNRTIGEAAIAPAVHTHVETDVTDLEHDAVKLQGTDVSAISPANSEMLIYAGGEWAPSGLPAGGAIDVQEDDAPKVSDVTILNFEGGATVTDEGGGKATILVSGGAGGGEQVKVSSDDTTEGYLEDKIVEGDYITLTVLNPGGDETLEITSTASGGGGGGDVSIEDEGGEITSAVTSLDFVGDQITATNIGDDVTVTFSGIVVTPPPFIGCKTYRNTDQQLASHNGWQNIDWTTEDYDLDSMWSAGANHNVNTAGYYNMIGQVTMSGALPTTENFQFGIFKNSTLVSTGWDGWYSTAEGNRTLLLYAESYFLDTDYIRLQLVCATSDQPYVVAGIENSFLASHMIQGAFIEGATPEVCRVVWQNYLTVPDATDTPVPWDAATYDTGDFWDGGDDTKFTISTDGYYNLKASALWETVYYQGGTPFGIRLAFRKNGSTRIANHWDWNDIDTGGARSQGLSTHIATDVYLENGDYVEVVAYHEKGSTANGIIRANDTYATIQRLS
jgi:hypothetical protein